jgi:translation elongation factor P/translation initiation factor 5A
MKISGVDIRPGNIIEYEGGIWRAVKIQHTQPGKGGAYMQVELKNLRDGRKNNVRFRSAETVERVRLDTKDFQFLFADGDTLTFMDKETYDQTTLPRDLLGDAAAFLQDGMDVVMELYDEDPISRGRCRGEGPDGLVLVQARSARQWRAHHGAAAHRQRHAHRRRRVRTDLRPPRGLNPIPLSPPGRG